MPTSQKISSDQLITRVPPQAVEMEKAVLGSLMVDESGYDNITDILVPDSFYDKKHQLIFEAIRDLASSDKPFDALAVKTVWRKKETLKKLVA